MTEEYSKNLDKKIVLQQADNMLLSDDCYECADLKHSFFVQVRLIRRKLRTLFRKKQNVGPKSILYITLQESPVDFIHAFQKQYPDKVIKVLRPVLKRPLNSDNTTLHFEFYSQNRIVQAILYKIKKSRANIDEYGLFLSTFAEIKTMKEIKDIKYLAPFAKALRICVKKIKPDLVQSNDIPFFLGSESEQKKAYPINVLQLVNDFSVFENTKCEAFWAAINLVDSKGMKKICRDKIIKKCVASLFNLHNTKRFYQMRECLEFIYKNYSRFRKYVDKCEDIEENILFNRLNARILSLFPNMFSKGDSFYNLMYSSIKKSNHWGVISNTYYKELLTKSYLSGSLYTQLESSKEKSSAFPIAIDIKPEMIYQDFSVDDFREKREYNKKALIREFSKERVVTKFSDVSLFKTDDYEVYGYLDSFYDSPLLFCSLSEDIYQQGVDVALNSILKIFEKYINIQLIVNIPKGMDNNYVASWVKFITKNSDYKGRWIFINSEINLPKFLAASDMILLPKRENGILKEHFEAMHYGCIPIASRSGIYNDTISDIFDDITNGCGFKTKTSLITDEDATEIYFTVLNKAINLYTQNPASWNLLIKNALNYNAGWSFQIIEEYNRVYQSLLE